MPQPIRRTQQQRRASTERRVVEAAIELIAQRGSRSVSIADIGVAAGYSRGIVTHQFGTKQDLLVAVVDHAQRVFAISAETGGLAELLTFVEQYLRLLREAAPTGQAFLLLWAEAVAGESSLKPLFVERDRSFRKVIAGHVRQGIEEGSIRADANPDGTASLILAILRGVGLHLMLDPRAVSHRTVTAAAMDTIRHALAPTDPPPTCTDRPDTEVCDRAEPGRPSA